MLISIMIIFIREDNTMMNMDELRTLYLPILVSATNPASGTTKDITSVVHDLVFVCPHIEMLRKAFHTMTTTAPFSEMTGILYLQHVLFWPGACCFRSGWRSTQLALGVIPKAGYWDEALIEDVTMVWVFPEARTFPEKVNVLDEIMADFLYPRINCQPYKSLWFC